jgi:hypothetical protein
MYWSKIIMILGLVELLSFPTVSSIEIQSSSPKIFPITKYLSNCIQAPNF